MYNQSGREDVEVIMISIKHDIRQWARRKIEVDERVRYLHFGDDVTWEFERLPAAGRGN